MLVAIVRLFVVGPPDGPVSGPFELVGAEAVIYNFVPLSGIKMIWA